MFRLLRVYVYSTFIAFRVPYSVHSEQQQQQQQRQQQREKKMYSRTKVVILANMYAVRS